MSTKSANTYIPLVQEPRRHHVLGSIFTPAPTVKTSFRLPSGTINLSTLPRQRWTAIKTRCADFVGANAGLLLIMLAQLFFSLMNLAVKVLDQLDTPVPALELIIVRMVRGAPASVRGRIIMKIPDPFLGPKDVRLLLVCRGVTGFFGLFGVYYSLQYLSLADTTVLTFLGPLFTAILGHLILKESYSTKEALAGLCSLFGVVLIARPPFLFGDPSSMMIADSDDSAAKTNASDRLRAVGVHLFGVLLASGAMISIRAIGKRAHAMHCMTFFSLWSVIVAASAMVFLKVPVVYPTHWSWAAMLLMIGIFGFAAQTCLTMGLQRETAARGTMGVYVQVIFAGVLERIFFKTVPSLLSMTGAAIIIASAIFVVLTKQKQSLGDVSVELGESAVEEGLLQHAESRDDLVKP
ncbi:hypothetical protein F5I97DRAFT_1808140 [Phlebopus sp. FC_14]|nr:hypothetical protein F5I97DRAFT_1808140 [Phlebopus sp. FC_14]